MAYDGIITYGITRELQERLTLGKIEKIYQPAGEDIIMLIHTKNGNLRLLASSGSQSARVCLTEGRYVNPQAPPTFCMLLRKHLSAGRITEIRQRDSERIIEMDIEAQTELGFQVSRRLIFEIMGKHSNIVLVALDTGKIIDSIKRISIDVNRYRQLLPGVVYQYPPEQDKVPFKEAAAGFAQIFDALPELQHDPKIMLAKIGGISPAIARELAGAVDPGARLREILADIEEGRSVPRVYFDADHHPREFHLTTLAEYEGLEQKSFDSISACVEFFFSHRAESNVIRQKSLPLERSVQTALDKALLKKQRLAEDLLKAENSEQYRLYGELLTANLHLIKPGAREVTVTSYYDGKPVTIPLSEKLSPSRNAQHYFKRYSKAKTAIHEKADQLAETENDIIYLESVLQHLTNAKTEETLDLIREELTETGYVRNRDHNRGYKQKKVRPEPVTYVLSSGQKVFVGRNNKENDWLTMRFASKTDLWFHTKDIPGSHVILPLEAGLTAEDLPAETIYEAASVAAWHSKARQSENVPVDFVPVRYIRKPNGAKPGMVIFTHNTTVYVTPKLPEQKVSGSKP
ncbi:MAG: NFACT family protein [Mogibacterium sp.]|nr:NFACT family protein [Mogibacterium sp.]